MKNKLLILNITSYVILYHIVQAKIVTKRFLETNNINKEKN